VDVYVKKLEDGGKAVAFFNRGSAPENIKFDKLGYIGTQARQHVRDLWRQTNLPDVANPQTAVIKVSIAAHSVELYKFTQAR
jgi:alpha-galactosidase